MSVGVGMRYYSAYGTDVKGTGLGFDLGLLYRPFNDRLRLAVAWQDINRPRIHWSSGARDELPYTVRTGCGRESDGGHGCVRAIRQTAR